MSKTKTFTNLDRLPLSVQTSNPGFDDRWTSPCCYVDMANEKAGSYRCPSCGRWVKCELRHEPVCVATIDAKEAR